MFDSIYITAWPEKGAFAYRWPWTKNAFEALKETQSYCPRFKTVRFVYGGWMTTEPKLFDYDIYEAPITEEHKNKGVAFFRVSLEKDDTIRFHDSRIELNEKGEVDFIEGETNESQLYVVAELATKEIGCLWIRKEV